jgi:F-type H+-transporting ATPase subunit c
MSKKGIYGFLTMLALSAAPAFAQGAEPAAGGVKWGVVGAAFAIAIAAAGGAFAQGKATAAACEGMARNPSAAGAIRPMAILGLALIESLVIYALVIAFSVQGKQRPRHARRETGRRETSFPAPSPGGEGERGPSSGREGAKRSPNGTALPGGGFLAFRV